MRPATLLLFPLVALFLFGCTGDSKQAKRDKDAEFYYSLSVNNFYAQNSQAALKELDSCFRLNPDHLKAHNLAGLIYLGRKQFTDALTHLEKALSLDPEYHEARANLGAVYMAMNDWNRAIAILSPLLHERLYPTPYLVENNIGWAYFKLGNMLQAEQHLKRALFVNNKFCLAYSNLGVVHKKLGRTEDALLDFNEAIKRCPDFVEPYYRVGIILQGKGEFKEAEKRFKQCERMGGENFYGRRCSRKLQAYK